MKPPRHGCDQPDVEKPSAASKTPAGRPRRVGQHTDHVLPVICRYMKPVPSSAAATSSGATSAVA